MVSNGSDKPTDKPTGKPVIGISCYHEPASWGVWNTGAALLPWSYVRCVAEAGGVPVLLPPSGDDQRDAVSAVDGLVLAGGADVDPSGYGAPAHRETMSRPERDAAEFAMLRAAREYGKPVLGVCRGMQVLNVANGGTLCQHLPDQVGHRGHQPAPGEYGGIGIELGGGSRVAAMLGRRGGVHCYHHQAVDRLGEGLVAVGWAGDGTVEAIESPGERFVVGVQWHPEQDSADVRLFAGLVEAART
ncbi:gamma-glutamyl-gamma-aminobutyrate hydrolase family protein [Saccharomonospora sp. NPDC006951]